jgi:hypothetical protein
MTKIIAFSGKKQSGKTTCCNFIYAMYLSQVSDIIESTILNQQGMIEVKKNNSKEDILVDVCRYYQSKEGVDSEIYDIIRHLDKHIKIYSFADPLKKQICMDILGLSYEQCYGTDQQKNEITHLQWEGKNISGREAMQIVGTDIFRSMYKDIWPKAAINKIKEDGPYLALISDCRFPNEVEEIKNNNGIVIRLTRNNESESSHISENVLNKDAFDWSNFDFVIDNENMSILDQCNELKKILDRILV